MGWCMPKAEIGFKIRRPIPERDVGDSDKAEE